MKIIALEEAFTMGGLRIGDRVHAVPDVRASDAYRRHVGPRLADMTELRLADMDAHGIDVQVLSLTAPGIQAATSAEDAIADARTANDYLAAAVSRHPTRFAGFAALPLQDPATSVRELERAVRELGFCGALVNDHTAGEYMDAPQFDDVWSLLEELDLPLYIHPGAPRVDQWHVLQGQPSLLGPTWAWGAETAAHTLRLLYGKVFDRHPRAKIIIGHMGEFLPFQVWRMDSRYRTLADQNLELMPSEYFGRNIFITTSGVFSPAALEGAVRSIGVDAVMFSIDYPFEETSQAVEMLHATGLPPEQLAKVAGTNAAKLLKLQI